MMSARRSRLDTERKSASTLVHSPAIVAKAMAASAMGLVAIAVSISASAGPGMRFSASPLRRTPST